MGIIEAFVIPHPFLTCFIVVCFFSMIENIFANKCDCEDDDELI